MRRFSSARYRRWCLPVDGGMRRVAYAHMASSTPLRAPILVIRLARWNFTVLDIIEGALAGEVPGQGITINQAFLAAATGYIVIPSLMVVASLLMPAKLNRRLNIGVSIFYAVSIAAFCIGESWIYYLLGSFFEVVLLLMAARTAWRWPTDDVPDAKVSTQPHAASGVLSCS